MSAITPVQILKTLSSSSSSSGDLDSLKKLQKVAQSTAADSNDSIKDDSFFTGNDSAKTRILQAVQACQAISKYTLESARTAPTSPTLTKTRRASFGPLEHHFHNHHLSLHPALDKQFKAHVISGSTGQGGAHEGPISILLKPANLAKEGGGEGDHAIWVVKGETDAQWVMPYSNDNDHDLIDRHTHFDAHGHDLLDHVRTTLLNQLRQKRVVFTGHGSGAAVVSWVYMQLLREIKESDKDLAPHGMDLITFGAAATRWAEQRASLYTSKAGSETSTDAVKRYFTEKNPTTNLCLALVNEGDPTPRLSKDYVAWISSAVSVADADGDQTKAKEALAKTPWHALLPFGQIVVLSADQKGPVQWIGKETFRQTVWVDPAQGDIDAYVKNVERLCK